jgi:phosphohistidine phosphatase
MKHQLIIVRHAKSARDDPTLDDFERPLSPRGLSEIPHVAKWLASQKLKIDYILSSTAKRARQTTELLCQGAGLDVKKIEWQDALYLADTATLLNAITHLPTTIKQLMIVGHNPGLEALLSHLCSDDLPLTKSGKLLTTSAIAIVALPDGWDAIKPHSGELIQLMRPKELAKH